MFNSNQMFIFCKENFLLSGEKKAFKVMEQTFLTAVD